MERGVGLETDSTAENQSQVHSASGSDGRPCHEITGGAVIWRMIWRTTEVIKTKGEDLGKCDPSTAGLRLFPRGKGFTPMFTPCSLPCSLPVGVD